MKSLHLRNPDDAIAGNFGCIVSTLLTVSSLNIPTAENANSGREIIKCEINFALQGRCKMQGKFTLLRAHMAEKSAALREAEITLPNAMREYRKNKNKTLTVGVEMGT